MPDTPLVRFEKDGEIGIITVDNPPVNALSPGVPQGIVDALDKGNADPSVKAMVLIGAGRSFIAGADIRQFGKANVAPPPTRRHYDVMDQSPKPVVAAIHGYALGGGLETALACHYRVAVPSAKVGLPEVLIGILPGAGGTQRLPRLIGPKAALEMITSGRHVPAEEAAKLGVIDEIVPEGGLKDAAVAFARKIAGKTPLPVIRNHDEKLAEGTPALFDGTRKSIARRARNQRAPYACIEAVEAACTMPFDEGCKLERKLFDEQVGSEEAKALRYAFFAEREASKIPFIPADTKQRPTDHPAVVGAGTMGGGIAMSFADNGYDVKITDATQEALERGMARIKGNYETSVKRGSLAQDEYERRFARIHPVPSIDDLKDCDVVIEAVFEQIDVKTDVWKKLDAVMPQGALLYSNTSGIDIDIMANATKRPQDVAGTHFFAPANVMKLFEVVKGTQERQRRAGDRDVARPQDRQGLGPRRQWRRLPRQPQPRAVQHGDEHPRRGRRAARADRQGDGRLRLSGRPVCGVRHFRARYRLRHPEAPRRADPELPQIPDLRPHRRGRTAGAQDQCRLVSLRTRRPHPANRPRGPQDHQGHRGRIRLPATRVFRRRDPEAAPLRVGQRGLQDLSKRVARSGPAMST